MQNPVPMTPLQSSQRHDHPTFHIRRSKQQRSIFDDGFEVGVEEFEDEVEVLAVGKRVQELPEKISAQCRAYEQWTHGDHIRMLEFPQEFNFSNR